jgi:hypothetical protein
MAIALDDAALQRLYSWVDEVPLSRPKRNITRDFSDGGAFFSALVRKTAVVLNPALSPQCCSLRLFTTTSRSW